MKLVKSVRKGLGERDSSGNLLVTIREGKKDRMDQGRYFLILWLGTVILSGWMGYLGGLEYEKTVCFGALFLLAAFLEFLLPEFPIFNQITYKSILYLALGLCPLAAFLLPPVREGAFGLCHDASISLAQRGIHFLLSGSRQIPMSEKTVAFFFFSLWILLFVKIFVLGRKIAFSLLFLFLPLMLLTEMRAGNGECTIWLVLCLFWYLLVYIHSLEGAILAALPLIILTIISYMVSGMPSEGGWRKAWTDFRYGQTRAVLPEGCLEKAGSMNRNGDTALIIEGDFVDTYYLKGYVGTVYRDNTWMADDQTLKDLEAGILGGGEKEFLSWLHEKDDSGWNALSDQAGTGNSRRLRIRNIHASRKYLYLPYELTTSPGQMTKHRLGVYTTGESILARGLMGRKGYEIETEHCLAGSMKSHTGKNAASHYYKAYEEYVNRTCLTLPKEVKEDLRRKLGGNSTEGVEEPLSVLKKIRKWIGETVSYDENPGTVGQGQDFVRWFLDENPRGYDVQYATIAVMLFRYYGIPSRYVEGYLTNHKKEMTQEDAHVWPEIYLSGYGWIPVEVMEEYQDKMPSYLETIKEDTVMEDQDGEDTEMEEKAETMPTEITETSPAEKKGSSYEKDDRGSGSETESQAVDAGSVRKLLAAAGALLFLLILLIVLRLRAWRAHRAIIRSIHPEECVIGWYRHCMLLLYELEDDQMEKRRMREDNRLTTWEKRWIHRHPSVDRKLLRQAGLLRQKAIYRDQGIDWKEADKVVPFFEEESRSLYEKLGVTGKIRIKFGIRPPIIRKNLP